MANPVFDPERALGLKVTKMDRQELCEFVSALCRKVVAEVGSRGRRGGIYPSNISVDDNGGIAIGPAGKSPWEGEELKFIAPELYWNGQLSAASDVYSVGMLMYYAVSGGHLPLEDECRDAQLRRMGGDDYPAPKAAGRRLGEIIEKCIRFKAADRYQTLDELRAVLDAAAAVERDDVPFPVENRVGAAYGAVVQHHRPVADENGFVESRRIFEKRVEFQQPRQVGGRDAGDVRRR